MDRDIEGDVEQAEKERGIIQYDYMKKAGKNKMRNVISRIFWSIYGNL